MKRTFFLLIAILSVGSPCFAANFPFPHSVRYEYGIKPSASQETMDQATFYAYLMWSDNYITSEGCPAGSFRVHRGEAYDYDTVSEGIGWGMLITVLMDNRQTDTKQYFDGLWKYYQSHLNASGLMNWKIDRQGKIQGTESATEADQNVALALLFASKQWGNGGRFNYFSEAEQLIGKILSAEVETKTFVLKPGASWGGNSITNPGYFAPAYYRLFEKFDESWTNVAARGYKIYDLIYAKSKTGLFPDWTVADGSTASRGNNYSYDACQVPLKIGLDYLWNGRGKKYLDKLNSWIIQSSKSNPEAIVDGYKLDGTPIGKYNNGAFVGPFTVAAMSDEKNQAWLDQLYGHLVRMDSGGRWGYYNDTIRLVSLLVLTGNFPNLWEGTSSPQAWLKS